MADMSVMYKDHITAILPHLEEWGATFIPADGFSVKGGDGAPLVGIRGIVTNVPIKLTSDQVVPYREHFLVIDDNKPHNALLGYTFCAKYIKDICCGDSELRLVHDAQGNVVQNPDDTVRVKFTTRRWEAQA